MQEFIAGEYGLYDIRSQTSEVTESTRDPAVLAAFAPLEIAGRDVMCFVIKDDEGENAYYRATPFAVRDLEERDPDALDEVLESCTFGELAQLEAVLIINGDLRP